MTEDINNDQKLAEMSGETRITIVIDGVPESWRAQAT